MDTSYSGIEMKESRDLSLMIPSVLEQLITIHASDAIYIMKADEQDQFTYLYVNNAALRSMNLERDDVLGKSILQVMGESSGRKIHDYYMEAKASKKNLRYRDVISDEFGVRTFETGITPIFNEETKENYMVAVARDVTREQKERDRLQTLEQRYRSIIEENLDAIVTLSKDGMMETANEAAEEIFDCEASALKGKHVLDLFPGEAISKVKQALNRSSKGTPTAVSLIQVETFKKRPVILQAKFVPIKLEGTVHGVYLIARDATNEIETDEKINYLHFHDKLTGLPNRQALKIRLAELTVKQKDDSHAILCLDLDNFKALNEALGYTTGDELLVKVSERLEGYSSLSNNLFRLTADEFIMIMENTSKEKIEKLASGVIRLFADPFIVRGQEYFISASIGISLFPQDGQDDDSLVNHAGHALQMAKRKGRSLFQFYNVEMNKSSSRKMMIENHLRRAIEFDELSLVYQPQVNLKNGEINSVEALLRWNNRKFGHVSPGEFIPVAEESGQILPIGSWVIDQACHQLFKWTNQGIRNTRIAINISPKQFAQENFDEIIMKSLEKYNVTPDLLEIEITESAMGNMSETLSMLKKLKEIGVKISVDDFGTGYSSLNYLRQFPIDILKIDQSFVKELRSEQKDAAITKTIIHLAHSLGLEVVAEGVEEQFQVRFLQKAHCQKGQGYFFSKPLPSGEMEKKLLSIG
ncbi:EAL domain-containing protein [Jeotgalibacillus sp. R-1-5s-1]|uniref:EAL domain-containing protein n=1 Tax=Jeotgalibacillus sp. R-1-5s-1 TaxID=2555897 RepID=UPI0010692572|nr:EAL domain-containing protein [Jeotgalibacillus sp. R-1-5s-1]TFE03663.1 EAL domain-containing protein [Jeotgalibacillus sp. R-1-5s-1]